MKESMAPTAMQTFTGKIVDLRNFTADDVRLADIAHALALINRFTGHSKVPYSVAQHSVMVSHLTRPENALWGLMHDASEAYLGDVARPLKVLVPEYRALEHHVQRVIASVFRLPWPIPEDVKHADNEALLAEKRDIITVDHAWNINAMPARARVNPAGWQFAKEEFSRRFRELSHEAG
jgi:hypothetical protein